MKQNQIWISSLLLIASILFGVKPAGAVQTFTDIKGHWAEEAVMASASCDMIKGFPDQSFRPDQDLTQLEALVLFMKSQGYALDKAASTQKKTVQNPALPVMPWGQSYFNTAYETYLLPPLWADNFQAAAPANRGQVAVLLGRLLNLGNETANQSVKGKKTFSDLYGLDQETRNYIYALHEKGIMNGFPDRTFLPQQPLKRSEAAALLLKLMEGSQVKTDAGRIQAGWVKDISPSGKKPEMTLSSLQGEQKLKLDPFIKCFKNGQESYCLESLNCLVNVYLDAKKQVSVISIQEKKKADDSPDELIAMVKSITLGEKNILVVTALDDRVYSLPLAWEAVLESLKTQAKGFQGLKAGTFVKVYISDDEVVRVTELKTVKVSGTVMSISANNLKLDEKAAKNGQVNSFHEWTQARIVDKEGKRSSKILRGDKVQVTYYDPDSETTDDEVPLEILISARPELKKVAGVLEKVSTSKITIQKAKEYLLDDDVKVYDGENGPKIRLSKLAAGDKIELYVDGAGVVMKVILVETAEEESTADK